MMRHFQVFLLGAWLVTPHVVAAEPQEAPGAAHWPASKSAYVPPLEGYFSQLSIWLQTVNQQWAVATVAFAFGLLNLLYGVASYRLVLTIGFTLVSAASAQYEVTLIWPDLHVLEQIFIVAEVGLLTALIVYMSIPGCNTILGVMLGLSISALLEVILHTENWHLNAAVIWYSVWGVIGVLLLTFFQKRTLAVLTPSVGGFLIASSIGYFVKFAVWKMLQQPHPDVPDWLVNEKNIHGDCWLDFAGALLGGAKPAGIFGTYHNENFTVNIDRALGRLFWLWLYYAGMKFQWKKEKEMKEKSFCMPLKQPLNEKKV